MIEQTVSTKFFDILATATIDIVAGMRVIALPESQRSEACGSRCRLTVLRPEPRQG
jgi:hypothetical protein